MAGSTTMTFDQAMKSYPLEEQLALVAGLLGVDVAEQILYIAETFGLEDEYE